MNIDSFTKKYLAASFVVVLSCTISQKKVTAYELSSSNDASGGGSKSMEYARRNYDPNKPSVSFENSPQRLRNNYYFNVAAAATATTNKRRDINLGVRSDEWMPVIVSPARTTSEPPSPNTFKRIHVRLPKHATGQLYFPSSSLSKAAASTASVAAAKTAKSKPVENRRSKYDNGVNVDVDVDGDQYDTRYYGPNTNTFAKNFEIGLPRYSPPPGKIALRSVPRPGNELYATNTAKNYVDDDAAAESKRRDKVVVTLNENDIMRIHYGSPTDQDFLIRRNRTAAKVKGKNEDGITNIVTTSAAAEMMNWNVEMVGDPFRKKNVSWHDNAGSEYFSSSRRIDGRNTTTTTTTARTTIDGYRVVDINNKDGFKPMIIGISNSGDGGRNHAPPRHTYENRRSYNFPNTSPPRPHLTGGGGRDRSENVDENIIRTITSSGNATRSPNDNVNEKRVPNNAASFSTKIVVVVDDVKLETASPRNISSNEPADARRRSDYHYYRNGLSNSIDNVTDERARRLRTKTDHGRIEPGKFFVRPIVIMDGGGGGHGPSTKTNLTAEYYQKLYDSFGGGGGGNENNVASAPSTDHETNSNTKKNLESDEEYIVQVANSFPVPVSVPSSSSITATATADSTTEKHNKPVESRRDSNYSADAERNRNIRVTKASSRAREKAIANETGAADKSGPGMLSSFFNISKLELRELVPKPLRRNFFLIKRLLIECYSDLEHVRSIDDGDDWNSVNCWKKITFKVLENAANSDVVRITDTVSLVKENGSAPMFERNSSRLASRKIESEDWLTQLTEKLQMLFSTHSLKIRLANAENENSQLEEGRRRHYRRLFPIMVGAYMILSTMLIPLGFKFMTLLGTKSLLVSKISLIIALMGGVKKYFGYGSDYSVPHSSIYPTLYPSYYPPYYDPWRRDEYRKISHGYDEPTEFSQYAEDIE